MFGSTNLFSILGIQEKKLINITLLSKEMRNSCTREGLLGLHVFTGVDSTSAFVGRGKKKAFALFNDDAHFREAFQSLGVSFDVPDALLANMERFFCKLYGQSVNDTNEARYNIFCTRAFCEVRLPPCRNALEQHVKRANYQAAIWRRALQTHINAPSPQESGWMIAANNQISVRWMTQEQAPPELLETYACKCKKNKCSNNQCSCVRSGVSCTELCSCISCSNDSETVVEVELLNDVSEDDDDD